MYFERCEVGMITFVHLKTCALIVMYEKCTYNTKENISHLAFTNSEVVYTFITNS